MKTLQLLLVIFTSVLGCTLNKTSAAKGSTVNTDKIHAMNTADTISYLAMGDSYTIGEAVSLDQSFPYQLKALLKSSNNVIVQDPTIIAITGWTADNLIDAISESTIHSKTYDFVTLLIGVNDQYQGLSQDNYRVKFIQLLNTSIRFAKGDPSRVFVLSIPDWGVTPFAEGKDNIIGPQIDLFNAINKAESMEAKVNYLDITDISRNAATDQTLVASDGLHPSGKMYKLWMQRLETLVAARLKR